MKERPNNVGGRGWWWGCVLFSEAHKVTGWLRCVVFFFSFAMLNECKWFLQQLGFYAILAPSFIYRNGWKGLWEVNNDNDMEILQKGGCGLWTLEWSEKCKVSNQQPHGVFLFPRNLHGTHNFILFLICFIKKNLCACVWICYKVY